MELGGQSDSIVNHVRVDGGWDSDIDENTAPNGRDDIADYYRVTDSDRLYYPLNPAKTTLDSADVWMRSQSEDSLRVRIQSPNEDNTGPRNPDNDGPDLVADNSGEAVADDGWRENFRFERYPLTSDPWLIIEASGEEGHDIGIAGYDTDGNPIPAFRTYYPFRILLNDSEQASIDQFGRRDGTLERDTIPDYDTARELADSYLRHHAWPERTIQFEALSVRAHTLEPGELVTVENPELGVNGDWIVSERSDEYNGQSSRLHTTITLQDPRSF